MPTGLLGVSLSGLAAAQIGIRTVQQNIANVNTPGYRKQDVNFATQIPQFTGGGYVGNGVTVVDVTHQYNQFLDNQVLLNQAQLSRYSTLSDSAASVDKLLGDSSTSLSPSLNSFFAAVQNLANDPASAMTRQNLLSSGQDLAGRFNMLADQLQAYRTSSNSDLQAMVDQINSLATQIAQANASIAQTSTVNGQPPSDMIDARDNLIANLNKLVNVSRQDVGNGVVNVFIGSGQGLVLGSTTFAMGTQTNATDPSLLDLTIKVSDATGAPPLVLNANLISGGELGGLMDYRQNILQPAMDNLNRIAMEVASAVNNVQHTGLDHNLAAGLDFFTNPVVAQGATAGQLNMTVGNDLAMDRLGYTIQLTAAGYVVTAQSTGVSTTFADLAALNGGGLGFTLSPGQVAPQVGDAWQIGNYARQMQVALGNTSQIAAAGVTSAAYSTNTGNASIGNVQVTGAADLGSQPVILTYDAATNQFSVSGAVPAVPAFTYTSGAPITINGLTFTISGAPATNDTFSFTSGAGNNTGALAMAGLQYALSSNNGTASFSAAYNLLVSQTAMHASQADTNRSAFQTLTDSAVSTQQAQVGVNLDEEAAKLIQFQQAYQASARALQISSSLFNDLLTALQ